jgi:hypothetical protein
VKYGFYIVFFFSLASKAQNVFVNLMPLEKRIAYHEKKLNYAEAGRLYELALSQKRNFNNPELHASAFRNYYRLGELEKATSCLPRMLGLALTPLDQEYIVSLYSVKQNFPPDSSTFSFYESFSRKFLFRDSASYQVLYWPGNTSASEYCAVPFRSGLLWTKEVSRNTIYKRNNLLNNEGFSSLFYSNSYLGRDSVEIKPEGILHCGPAAVIGTNRIATNLVAFHQKNKLNVYYSTVQNASLTENSLLEISGFSYPVSQVTMNKEHTLLYFVSSTPHGYGGTDLFMARWGQGQWEAPVLLGPSINTSGNERFPCWVDDSTLAFSSDGAPGLGRMDIFFARFGKDTVVWNPGFPFNSNFDDFGYAHDTLRNCAWISSNRNSKGKDDDIWQVFTHRMTLQVRAQDEYHQRPLKGAQLALLDADTNVEIPMEYDSVKCVYLANIKPNYAYRLIGEMENYYSDSLLIVTRDSLRYVTNISRTLTFRKKYLYYASIKLFRDGEATPDSTRIRLVNLSSGEQEQVQCAGSAYNRRLELDCEYLLVSGAGDSLRYIFIEKKPRRKGTTMTYYNMYLSQPKPVEMHIESDVFKRNQFMVSVFDLIQNKEVELKKVGSKYVFTVLDSRFFEVKVDNKRFPSGKIPKEILGTSLRLGESAGAVE